MAEGDATGAHEHIPDPGHKPEGSPFDFLKGRWPLVILLAILVLGFWLRAYHLSYPVIGYHNWKEAHYLTEARTFARQGFFTHGFFVPATDYPIGPHPEGAHPDTFPFLQIILTLGFWIGGIKLVTARLISVLFSVGAVAALYLLTKQLFKREDAALFAAALGAILPLWVFFGRNVQLDNPALFFMLLSGYYFLKWRESDVPKHLLLTSIFFTLGTLTKYTFGIILLPMLLTFPYKRLLIKEWKQKKQKKTWLAAILIPLTIPLWMVYNAVAVTGTYGIKEALAGETVKAKVFSDPQFWATIKAFIVDNYTFTGYWISIIGLILAVLMFRKFFSAKFIAAYAVSAIPWFFIMGFKLAGHSYHQYPVAPLVVLGITFLAMFVGNSVAKIVKMKLPIIQWALFIAVFALLFSPFAAAKDRQFDTQFPGLDVAGQYINEHAGPDDKILHSGHQSYGVHWHADRKGGPIPGHLEQLKDWEAKGARWLFIYQWGIPKVTQNPELWEYIQQNYRLVQMGFQRQGDQNVPMYLLLRKEGTFDANALNELIAGKPPVTHRYERTTGPYEIYTVDIE